MFKSLYIKEINIICLLQQYPIWQNVFIYELNILYQID